MSAPTKLADDEISELRLRARREAGPFVDPRVVNAVSGWWRLDLIEWASAIVGRDVGINPSRLSWEQMYLLHIARGEEPDPPPPPKLTALREQERVADEERARREHAAWQEKWDGWERIRAAFADLGAPVSVAHNFASSRHYEFYEQGADHIIVWNDLSVGRLKRAPREALCETSSKHRSLLFDNAGMERKHQEQGWPGGEKERRLPTCKACLRIARRITVSPQRTSA